MLTRKVDIFTEDGFQEGVREVVKSRHSNRVEGSVVGPVGNVAVEVRVVHLATVHNLEEDPVQVFGHCLYVRREATVTHLHRNEEHHARDRDTDRVYRASIGAGSPHRHGTVASLPHFDTMHEMAAFNALIAPLLSL